jgi:hypothetical protein
MPQNPEGTVRPPFINPHAQAEVSNPATEKQPANPEERDQRRRIGFRYRSEGGGTLIHLNDLIHTGRRKRGIAGFSDPGGKRR